MVRPHGARIATADTRRIRPRHELQGTDPYLLTKDHRAWAAAVIKRAGYRCQGSSHDERYPRTGRLVADHIIERRDNQDLAGASFNGQALCYRCHSAKTMRERIRRLNE